MTISFSEKDIKSTIEDLSQTFSIVHILDLVDMFDPDWIQIYNSLKKIRKDSYDNNERILIVLNHDWYDDNTVCGMMLEAIQIMLNEIDISNFFIRLITTNKNISVELQRLHDKISSDSVAIDATICQGTWESIPRTSQLRYNFTRVDTIDNFSVDQISPKHYDLLFNSDTFCLAPWGHLFVDTDSNVLPCCQSRYVLGNTKSSSLKQIWNDLPLRRIRQDMLANRQHEACTQCYVGESLGKKSYRNYINQMLMSRVKKVDMTAPDGTHDLFEINYLHFKFSNLCNLACRTCSVKHSSSWHQIAIALGDITKDTPALLDANYDGKLFEEFKKHIDHMDLIKFTGGEPLMMQECYDILDLLVDKNRTELELFYNTNLMQLKYKKRNILDYWKQFSNVVIGASLDAEGDRGEYIRSLSKWSTILENRLAIKEQCPDVYFFITPTINIINALHLPDFHRSWVEQGLIGIQDFDINILSEPSYLCLKNAPDNLKQEIKSKYLKHLKWINDQGDSGRSASSFESIVKYIEIDGVFDKKQFWHHADRLDRYHGTHLLDVFPELSILEKNT